ncbi:MAG: outer membrane beta-barrel protein, partial [Bacteroidota bacterium]
SLTTGYTTFGGKDGAEVTTSMIPVLVGYRQNFSGLYIEPQIGFSTLRVAAGGFSASTTGFAYAAAVGYAMEQGLDLSARYQAVSKDGTAGYL